MPSARIYHFPNWARRRPVPPLSAEYSRGRRPWVKADGFAPLLSATLVGGFLYLSGAAGLARHDELYTALLAAVWCIYFSYERLLKTRLGPLLLLAIRLLLLGGVFGFFGLVYWLILTHP